MMAGIFVRPSDFAAWVRVCPAMITWFVSTMMGCCQPNRLMLLAVISTAFGGIFLGLFGAGLMVLMASSCGSPSGFMLSAMLGQRISAPLAVRL